MNRRMHFTHQFRNMSLLLLVLLLIGLVQTSQSAAVPQRVPNFAAIDAYVATERATLQIPGLALGIVHGEIATSTTPLPLYQKKCQPC